MQNAAAAASGSPARPGFAANGYVDKWPEDPREFGAKVKAQIQGARLTRRQVAQAAGLSETSVRSILTGRHWATQDTRWRVIKALEALSPAGPPAAKDDAHEKG